MKRINIIGVTQYLTFIIVIGLLFSLNSCSENKKHDTNNEGIRIISLVPSLTRELVSLGLKDNIVGATSHCDISKSNKDLIIGTGLTMSIEKIMLLKPDIVFASSLTKDKTISALQKNGIKVHKFGKKKSFEDICSHFIEMGQLVDKREVAAVIVENYKNKIDSLIKTIPIHKKKLRVLIQIGSNPIYAVTPKLFMDDYITLSGCENVIKELSSGAITREAVLNKNPDVIFVVTMGVIGKNEIDNWKSFDDLEATKQNRIYVLNSNMVSQPTVASFTNALEIIINKLYKK